MPPRHGRIVVALVAALVALAAGVGSGAVAPAPASAASAKVFLLGDSVMAGLRFSSSALGSLSSRYDVTLDAKVCRALLEPSCSTQYDGKPPAALTVLRADRGQLGDVVVMMVGYNDSGIGPKVDAVMGELEAQGVPHVLWLTYRNPNGRYSASNETLAAEAAAHPSLRIADWNSFSAGHDDWFAGDGLHLTGAGAQGLAGFLATNIDAVLDTPPPRCAGATQGNTVAGPGAAASRGSQPSGFVTATPTRVVDTRTTTPVAAGHALDLDLSSVASADATAALVNITAVAPCGSGFLTAYPCDGAVPLASNVNYVRGVTVANQAIPMLSGNRHVCVYTSATTDVVVDLSGWFAPGAGWRYQPVTPVRVVDTRDGHDALRPMIGAIPAGGTLAVPVAPPPGAQGAPLGAMVNVTAVDATGPGFLTVSTCGTAPVVSTLNYDRGQVVANLATASIVGDGTVCIYSSASTDVVVDLEGWFGTTGEQFTAQTPQRVVDTRAGTGGSTPTAGGVLTIAVPQHASAVLANVTAVGANQAGYLTTFPCGPVPVVSTVDYAPGAIVPGLAAVSTASSADAHFCVSAFSATDVVVDVAGTFG